MCVFHPKTGCRLTGNRKGKAGMPERSVCAPGGPVCEGRAGWERENAVSLPERRSRNYGVTGKGV